MTETPENTTNGPAPGSDDRPAVPRAKMWIFAILFLTVAVTMYAGTMYRINTYGYTGIGEDQKAHPNAPSGTAAQQ